MKTTTPKPRPVTRLRTKLVSVALMGAVLTTIAAAAHAQAPKRRSKTDSRVRSMRMACKKGLDLSRFGSRAGRLVRNDGALNVTITFDDELSTTALTEYESRGVSFMRLPGGQVANYGRFYPAWVNDAAVDMFDEDPRVEFVEMGGPLHADEPLARSVAEIQADLQHRAASFNNPTGNRGAGVIITNFDTGIDPFHPDFFKVQAGLFYDWVDADNNGIFIAGIDCVDLDRNGSCTPNEALGMAQFPYEAGLFNPQSDWLFVDANGNGTRDFGPGQFSESDATYGELILMARDSNGNNRLDPGEKMSPLGESKIIGILTRDDSGQGTHAYRRGIDLIEAPVDTNGHGTSVSSIMVAGAAGYNRSTTGVAPDAELLVVDRTKVSNLLFAMSWAKANGADIMLWEFGGYADDYLDGSSTLEQAITQEMVNEQTVQVTPNGNLGSSNKHAEVGIAQGSQVIQSLAIPEDLNTPTAIMNILWHGGQEDDLQFAIRRAGTANFLPIDLAAGGTSLDGGYGLIHPVTTSGRGTVQVMITLYRTPGTIEPGQWDLRITAERTVSSIHMFVKDAVTPWSGGAVWANNTSDATTLTFPSTADVSINVGSYSVRQQPGELSYFSGRGPRIDGESTLDVTAPGHHDITCAETGAIGIWAAGRVDFGGTSAAGPHVAGAAALLLSAVPSATPQQIAQSLNDGAVQDGFTGAGYNEDWGHGKVRIDSALLELATLCPSIALSGFEPAQFATGLDPEDVTYSWTAQNAERYALYIGKTNPPTTLIPSLVVTSLSAGTLAPNTTYYWQVSASTACGAVVTSDVMTFTTGGLNAPLMHLQTADGAIDLPHNGTYVFPPVEVGETHAVELAILNNGPFPLAFTDGLEPVRIVGNHPEFEIVEQPVPTVPPFGQRSVVVRFAPDAGGEFEAFLSIPSNDPNTPYSLKLQGSALEYPDMMVTYNYVNEEGEPEFLDIPNDEAFAFPDTQLGDESDLIFGIRNLGAGDLRLLGDPQVQIVGEHAADFVVTLPPTDDILFGGGAGSAAYRIAFVPSAAGLRTAEVSIPNNDPLKPSYNYTVSGYAIDPDAIEDCNANGQDDGADIDGGAATDCNNNRVPDECESDVDQDGVIDPCDQCPGADDHLDSDGDQVADCLDNCPGVSNPDQLDADGNGLGDSCEDDEEVVDCNGNGRHDEVDLATGSSADCNGDGTPDECEQDDDGDRVPNGCDRCPGADDRLDGDGDQVADCLDNCPNFTNPDQLDANGNGVGDVCEQGEELRDCNSNGQDDEADITAGISPDCDGNTVPDECQVDSDQDRIIDACDVCPGEDDQADRDDDGVVDCLDNCPRTFNPQQVDEDGDGLGDACAEFGEREVAGFCGAGSPSMMMLMMLGLCGSRLAGRRRRSLWK